MTAAEKKAAEAAAKAAEQAISGDVVYQAAAPAPLSADADAARKARIAALDEEIRLIELETKLIELDKAKRDNQDYKQTKEYRERMAAQAQANIAAERRTKAARVAECSHRSGGFGLEDMLTGDGKPCLVTSELPIQGMKIIVCPRCLGQWVTPHPDLKRTDPDRYVDEMTEWKAILRLERESLSKPMGGPNFTFTNEDGVPALPHLD